MTTIPVFEHVVADLFGPVDTTGTVPTSVVAKLDRLLRQWDAEDADKAHDEIEGYVASVREQVGEGQAFLDESALHPDTLLERLEPLIEFWRDHHPVTDAVAEQQAKDAEEALESAQRCYRVLQTAVDNLNDPTILDRVDCAVVTLTPREGE